MRSIKLIALYVLVCVYACVCVCVCVCVGGGGGAEGEIIEQKRNGMKRDLHGHLWGANRSMMDETFGYRGNMRDPKEAGSQLFIARTRPRGKTVLENNFVCETLSCAA